MQEVDKLKALTRFDGDESQVTAYHEAGHIVMAAICGGSVSGSTINPSDDMYGYCKVNPYDKYGHVMNDYGSLMTHLAGVAAEQRVNDCSEPSVTLSKIPNSALDNDFIIEKLTQLHGRADCNDAQKCLASAADDVIRLFSDAIVWERIGSIAKKLIEFRYIDGKLLDEMVCGVYAHVSCKYALDCHNFPIDD
jgi:hypothetical protein